MTIYPEAYFPFVKSHWVRIDESEARQQEREERLQRKKELGKLPDDSYTVIIFVDVYNFKGVGEYHGEGVSLQMVAGAYIIRSVC